MEKYIWLLVWEHEMCLFYCTQHLYCTLVATTALKFEGEEGAEASVFSLQSKH